MIKEYVLADEVTYEEVLRVLKNIRKIKNVLDADARMSKKEMLVLVEKMPID